MLRKVLRKVLQRVLQRVLQKVLQKVHMSHLTCAISLASRLGGGSAEGRQNAPRAGGVAERCCTCFGEAHALEEAAAAERAEPCGREGGECLGERPLEVRGGRANAQRVPPELGEGGEAEVAAEVVVHLCNNRRAEHCPKG